MHKTIEEVLRLKFELELSERDIAVSCRLSKTSVSRYLKRAHQAGLTWPLPEALDDETLEIQLFPDEKQLHYTLPDFQHLHHELKRKGVTLLLLWEEYRMKEAKGISYSRFCQRYREFKKELTVVMRQAHTAGEKLFVDYAGLTLTWCDQSTGEVLDAQIFVAVLGASNYTYVEATATQALRDWIHVHVNTFKFLGGVPIIVVPDNLKSAITKANHYGIAVVPARARKPRDKAKAEVGVQGIEHQILAKLRDHTFLV